MDPKKTEVKKLGFETKNEKKSLMSKCHIENQLLDKMHEKNKNEVNLCDLYMQSHYTKFSKKRFPWLYDDHEITTDVKIDAYGHKMRLQNHMRGLLADTLASKLNMNVA